MRDDENLTAERPTFVTHLECSATGARYAADELHNLSRERKPLLVRYDLAGVKKTVFCPEDTPEVNVREIALQGATVYRVNGLIDDCGKIVAEGAAKVGWFDTSTLKEPYRIEGKKTMGIELAEQLGWEVPDVILYPTGGGTGLIGMWKAFAELETIGFIGSKRPRMVAV